MSEYTPTTERVRDTWANMLFEGGASDEEIADPEWERARSEAQFDRWLAQYTAEKRAEWEAEQGWEYAIGAEYEDRPGKFWRDDEWSTTTELPEALDMLDTALPIFSNVKILRRRPSTPWLPVEQGDGAPKHEIRCDYCGDALPSLLSRAAGLPTPNLIRRGFDQNKIVCPECVAANACPSCETSRLPVNENGRGR